MWRALALLAVSGAAAAGAQALWTGWNDPAAALGAAPDAPRAPDDAPRAPDAPREEAVRPDRPARRAVRSGRSPRVVVIVTDGLRRDTARALPALSRLGRLGLARDARAEPPTYSAAQYVALATGLPPARSGVRNNRYPAPWRGDSLLRRARAAGLAVAGCDDGERLFSRLFSPDLDAVCDASDDRAVIDAVLSHDLSFVVPGAADRAGHRHGAESPEYRAAARGLGARVERIAAALDLPRDALLAVADHGHRARGGHGGGEPEVARVALFAAGAGLRLPAGEPALHELTRAIAAAAGVPAPSFAPLPRRETAPRRGWTAGAAAAALALAAFAVRLRARIVPALVGPAAFAAVHHALLPWSVSAAATRGRYLVTVALLSLAAAAVHVALARRRALPAAPALLAAALAALAALAAGGDYRAPALPPPALMCLPLAWLAFLSGFALWLAAAAALGLDPADRTGLPARPDVASPPDPKGLSLPTMKPSTAGSLGFVIGVLLAAAGTMFLYARGVLVPPGAGAPPGPPAPAEPDPELAAELQRLRGEVDDLRARVRAGPLPDPERRTYGLSQAELRALAERCELRWDMPPLPDGGPVRISDHDARALGLTDEQRGAADAVFGRHHERLTREVRALYAATRPDADASKVDAASSLADLTDRASLADRQRAVQRVARERAGLAAPPADAVSGPPVERLYRLLVGAGDAVEHDLGGAIGADLARRLRDLHGGFGATWHHAYGCP